MHIVSNTPGHASSKSPWWRHQMETFYALLAICAGNSLVISEFPAQRLVTRSLDVFFDLRLNKRLSEFTGQMASDAENVSIWWRHHVNQWWASSLTHVCDATGHELTYLVGKVKTPASLAGILALGWCHTRRRDYCSHGRCYLGQPLRPVWTHKWTSRTFSTLWSEQNDRHCGNNILICTY